HLLHARGEVHGVADGGVVHGEVVGDASDHDGAGVQADAEGRVDLCVVDVLGERALDVERGGDAAAGGVLVGDRRAEERHDAVAGELGDGAFVFVDAGDHELDA